MGVTNTDKDKYLKDILLAKLIIEYARVLEYEEAQPRNCWCKQRLGQIEREFERLGHDTDSIIRWERDFCDALGMENLWGDQPWLN